MKPAHYKFKYRKSNGLFWKIIVATGHKYYSEMDRMDVFHVDGSITSLAQWSKYDLKLGTDWVLFTKKQMEKESGQRIDLAVQG
jgi:hypothetical protein